MLGAGVRARPRPGLRAVAAGLVLAGEQRDDVLGVGQPAQRDRAELVAGGVGGQVGDQVAAGVQGLGDLVQGRVQPDPVGGHHRGDHGAEPELVGGGDRDVAAASSGLPLGPGLLGVGLDHLRLGDRQQPPGPLVDRGRHRPVDQRCRLLVEGAGHRGDLARDPQVAAALAHRGVELGQPVPQVQAVGHQRADGQGVLAPGDGQLADRQVHHPRGADPTEPDQPRPTRNGWLPRDPGLLRVVRVQVGPVQRELELTHLDRASVPHRRLGRSQRPRSVEVLDGKKAGRLGHDSTQPPATDKSMERWQPDPQSRRYRFPVGHKRKDATVTAWIAADECVLRRSAVGQLHM